MNTVLGVFVLILKGQIIGAAAIGGYPTVAACRADMHAKSHELTAEPPKQLAVLCVDLGDDIKNMKPPGDTQSL